MGKLNRTTKWFVGGLAVLFGVVLLGLSLPMGGWRTFSVQTGSMEPAVATGSLVVVRNVPVGSLKPGDIITYINPTDRTQTITHRLVNIRTSSMGSVEYITKGDANALPDTPVSAGQIVGLVQYHVPFLGRVSHFLFQPLGLILLVYIPALGVILEEMKRLTAYYRAQRLYQLAGYEPHHDMPHHTLLHAKIAAGLVLAITLGVTIPVHAALQSQATIKSSSISSKPLDPQTSNTTCNISSNNSFTITNNTYQSTTSGNAYVGNNTSGGNATSGSATNTNQTNTNITAQNNVTCPGT